MSTKYENLRQLYLENIKRIKINKEEAGILLNTFIKSLSRYLDCSIESFVFIKNNLDFTDNVFDAIHQNDSTPPWILNFGIIALSEEDLEDFISTEQAMYSIQVSVHKLVSVDNTWEVRVSFSAVEKIVLVHFYRNKLEHISEDDFQEIDEFIYNQSINDLRNYYKRYLNFTDGGVLSKPSLGFLTPSLKDRTQQL